MSCVTCTIVTAGLETAVDPQQDVLELRARERVDRRERLVQEKDLRPRSERPRDRHPLLHPTGELPRVLARDVARPISSSDRLGPRRSLGLESPAPRSGSITLRITVSHGKSERL